MTWVRLDDGFFDHPKAITAGPLARELFLASCCWSAQNLTDGVIHRACVELLLAKSGANPADVERLVTVGLWLDDGEKYLINGYLERNPSRAKVEKDRARWRSYKAHSAVESTEDSAVDSSMDSALSRPDPFSSTYTPLRVLTGAVDNSRGGGEVSHQDVITRLVAQERQASNGAVRNQGAWTRKVTARLEAEHGARIDSLLARYPTAPADIIAGAVIGETNSLRYYNPEPSS